MLWLQITQNFYQREEKHESDDSNCSSSEMSKLFLLFKNQYFHQI